MAMMAKRLVAIRAKLTELATLDRGHVTGEGADNDHPYRERPPLDERGLGALERALGVILPDEVRAFLGEVHGGGPGPGCGFFVEPPPAPTLRASRPFLYRRADAKESVRLDLVDDHDDGDEWPPGPGFVAIAHHCGSFDVLVTAGDERGHVWFCDMAWFPRLVGGASLGFLDWYEGWLDAQLAQARRRTRGANE